MHHARHRPFVQGDRADGRDLAQMPWRALQAHRAEDRAKWSRLRRWLAS